MRNFHVRKSFKCLLNLFLWEYTYYNSRNRTLKISSLKNTMKSRSPNLSEKNLYKKEIKFPIVVQIWFLEARPRTRFSCHICSFKHSFRRPNHVLIIQYWDKERVVDRLPLMTYGLKLSLEAWILEFKKKIIHWYKIQWVAAKFRQLKFFCKA